MNKEIAKQIDLFEQNFWICESFTDLLVFKISIFFESEKFKEKVRMKQNFVN